MKRLCVAALSLCVAAAACERQPAPSAPAPQSTQQAGDHAERAAENVGRGTLDAVRSAGHGVVYGVRELGQSMSGTQGNPAAEARSAEQRALMEQRAHQAGQAFDQAGHAIDQSGREVNDREAAPPPPAPRTETQRGGGPITR